MLPENRLTWFYAASLLFAVVNIFLILHEVYWLNALPFALGIMLLFFFSLDKLILILVFLTPLSINLRFDEFGFTVNMPTEPIMVAIMMLFFLRLIYEGRYDQKILKHPVTILLLINIVWMLVTTVTSEMPVVSVKYFAARMWFVTTFFFVGIYMFKEPKRMQQFMWFFGIALVIVVIVATARHSTMGFERQMNVWAVHPFFNDHTQYSAVIALVAPFFAVMAFNKSDSVLRKRFALIFFVILCLGILFSYSRASWLSLFIAAAGFLILAFRVRFRFLLAFGILLLSVMYLFQTEIVMHLERNQQESSADFAEHIRSASNITSDASNLERINRWRAAYRMFEERPVLGWGPGTYQFVYAPFQRSEDYTVITTHFGDLGNAHSEYFGPLSESGMPGMLSFVALALAVVATGVKLFKKAPTRELRLIALGLTLGFITYFIHGFLNNFLDTDKASVPFWGMVAILVAMDVFYGKRKEATPGKSLNKQAE